MSARNSLSNWLSQLKSFHFWTWLTVIISIGICLELGWLRYAQTKTLKAASHILDTINQAQSDLAKGFLSATLAGDSQSPFRREEGMALISQAIASLEEARKQENALTLSMEESRGWRGFNSRVESFRSSLGVWQQVSGENREAAWLRLWAEFHQLEQYTTQVDQHSRATFQRLNDRLDRLFQGTLISSAILLCGACVGIYVAGRSQRRALRAMLYRKNQLRSVGDNLPEGYIFRYQRRPDGKPVLTYVSAGVERIHGVSVEDCLRDASILMSQMDPAQAAEFEAAEAKSARDMEDFAMDLRFRHVDGRQRVLHVRSRPVNDEQGRVVWDGLASDVTERRQAENIIRSKELLLQEMGGIAKVGAWELDVATGQGTWTEEVARIYDLEPHITPNRELGLSFYSDESRARILAAMMETIERGKPYDLELEMVSAKGMHKWVHTIGKPIHENGKVVRLRGSFQDITPLKETELALRNRERQLQLFVEHSPAAIAMLDADMRYLVASHRWRTDYRLNDADLTGRSHYEVFPEIPACWREIHKRCLAGATEKCDGEPFSRADGSLDWVRWEIVPWRKDDGAIGGLIILSELITKQKEAEETIRRQQRNYEEIFNAANDAFVLHDAESGRILDVNDAFVRMLGYHSKAEVLAANMPGIFSEEPPYSRSEALRNIHRAVEQGPQVFEWQARKKNGRQHWLEVSLTSSQIGGVGRVLATVRDISLRKAHELEIARLTRLYSTLSQINQVIVRCQTREALFKEICRVMIEFGKMRAVWIGIKDQASGELVHAAHQISGSGKAPQSVPGWEAGCGVISEMLKTSASALCNNAQSDHRTDCCRSILPQMGIQSCAAFPLRFQGQIVGAFSMCATDKDFFRPEEIFLLEEIADDISYSLDRLDEQAQHRLAEQALQQSEEQFRLMFETAAIGMAQADLRTGQFLRANQKMCEITGYTEAELLHQTVPAITHPQDRDRDWEAFQRVVRGEAPVYHMEKRYLRKDGSVVWVNVNMTIVRDPEGNPVRTLATIEDVTKRKEAETERILLTTAMEQAAESIVITDVQGNILYVNPAFERLSGYSRQEAIGQNPRVLKSGQHPIEFYSDLWKTIRQGKVWTGRFINRKKNGTLFEEEATITPVRNPAGKIINYVAVKRDITREVELESHIRQVQKMEGIGQLAGGVAHDFNNILAAIMMQAQLTEMDEELPPSVAEDMQHIRQSCERGSNLTRQLLLFSRKQIIQPRDLDLNESVTNITKMLQRVIGENVSIQLNLAGRPMLTHADPGMIDQVLLNLAVNGRDAMEGNGRLTISTSEELVDEVAASLNPEAVLGRHVCFAISDTGCGISPEVLPRIFEPFYTTKEQGKGTGLGLATVFGIVKQHKGWIQVQTELGKGTTFKIYLPASVRSSPPAVNDVMDAQLKGKETILLAEDDFSVRTITRKLLENQGYTVIEASNGVKALELWQQHGDQVNLLLTDLLMPEGINGSDLASQIKADRPDLKVIYFSGYASDLVGRGLDLRPGENFLQKPVQPAQLLKLVRRRLDERSAP